MMGTSVPVQRPAASSCFTQQGRSQPFPRCHTARDRRSLRAHVHAHARANSNLHKTPASPQRSAQRDAQRSVKACAASPALDSSGGDLPPRDARSKAVGEDDDDSSEGSSAAEIEQILLKGGSGYTQLPSDMQGALDRGVLHASDVKLWLQLMSTPIVGSLAKLFPAFRDRMLGNPRFLMVLAIEEAIGVAAKWSAEVNSRGDRFKKEFDFVLSDMALEVIGDFAVVWLLSPKKSFSPQANTAVARYINRLPGHCLQTGNFKATQRAATVLYRGAQFFAVSFVASMAGHSLTKYLVERSRAKSGQQAEAGDKELAPVLDNSIAWGGFVATSTNVRYQLVNGFEERALDAAVHNTALKSALIFLIRFGNTFWGGAQWVQYAKLIGIQ